MSEHDSVLTANSANSKAKELYFTTSREISPFILKHPRARLPQGLVTSLLQRSSDLEFFLGATHSKDPAHQLRLYSFDMCINEQSHPTDQINSAHDLLLNDFLKTIDPGNHFNDFIFLFGSASTELNLKDIQSLFSKYFTMYQENEPILFLKVVLYFRSNELVIVQKNLDGQIDVEREIEEALVEVRKIKKTFGGPDIKDCGHLVVQFNNHFVV